MQTIRIVILVASILVSACTNHAVVSGVPACGGKPLTEIDSIAALPAGIEEQLGWHGRPWGKISDRGGPFTDGCIGANPRHRFVLAGTNDMCSLVVLEHGGFAYSIEMTTFKHTEGGWQLDDSSDMSRVPKTLQDLAKLVAEKNKSNMQLNSQGANQK